MVVVDGPRGAARPSSLHLRWRKHSCARGLVRGTPVEKHAFDADLSSLESRTVYDGRSTATPAMQLWHQRFHQRGLVQQRMQQFSYSMQVLCCSYLYHPMLMCLVGGVVYRPGGGGCGCTSKEMGPGISSSQIMHAARGCSTQRLRLHSLDHPCRVAFVFRARTMATPVPPLLRLFRMEEACKDIRLPSVLEVPPDLVPSFFLHPNTFLRSTHFLS